MFVCVINKKTVYLSSQKQCVCFRMYPSVCCCCVQVVQAGRSGGGSSVSSAAVQEVEPQGLAHAKDTAEHEQMKAVLKSSLQANDSDTSVLPGLRIRTRTRASRGEKLITIHRQHENHKTIKQMLL